MSQPTTTTNNTTAPRNSNMATEPSTVRPMTELGYMTYGELVVPVVDIYLAPGGIVVTGQKHNTNIGWYERDEVQFTLYTWDAKVVFQAVLRFSEQDVVTRDGTLTVIQPISISWDGAASTTT